MRITYFHGWGGNSDAAKIKILSKFGDEVSCPNINYQNQKNLINSYSNNLYDDKRKQNLIIGSSLGGYLAHYVSNIIQCPALLFNPAFFFKNGGEIRPNSNSDSNEFFEKKIIFSLKDEELDIKRCIKFLKDKRYDDQIKIYNSLTHQIPLDIFENEFIEFREKYSKLEEKQLEKKLSDEMEKELVSRSMCYGNSQSTTGVDELRPQYVPTKKVKYTIGEDDTNWQVPVIPGSEINQRILEEKKRKYEKFVNSQLENMYGSDRGLSRPNIKQIEEPATNNETPWWVDL